MPQFRSLVGQRFGRLVVTARAENVSGRVMWTCACDCGKIVTTRLDKGPSEFRSCGCGRPDSLVKHGATRNQTRSKEYLAWHNAKRRCYDPKATGYELYGGRGIRMCAEWIHNSAGFMAYMGPCPSGQTLDRINTNGDYEPGNVRWATPLEQMNNIRRNRFVRIDGVRMTLSAAARFTGVPFSTLKYRFQKAGLIE